jgi:dipeptidyl aminopeptidase/acylaminoacyl peptidase
VLLVGPAAAGAARVVHPGLMRSSLGDRLSLRGFGTADIYVMNTDGSGKTNLTNDPADDYSPTWSPDGTKIAFARFAGEQSEIYAMNSDGSGQTNLTNNPADDFSPAWSPDGTKIAFTRFDGGQAEIFVMSADGTGQTNLTNGPRGRLRPGLVARRLEDCLQQLPDRRLRDLRHERRRQRPDEPDE